MNVRDLHHQLVLFAQLIERAQTANYALALGWTTSAPAVCLARWRARSRSTWGRELCQLRRLPELLRSLPNGDFKAKLDNGALRWTCGQAKGHLSLMTTDSGKILVPPPRFDGEAPQGTIDEQFGTNLELGALSCGSIALRALGLQGVQIKNIGNKAYACATDNMTFSSCCLGDALEEPADPPETITLSMDAVALLAALLKRDEAALLTYDDSSVYCVTATTRLLLHQITPLKVNITNILDQFMATKIRVPLSRDAVKAFLRRAEALTEGPAMVEVSVDEGRTCLAFNEGTSSSQEFYVVENGPKVTVPAVRSEAQRLAKALAYANDLVFDYAEHNVLIRVASTNLFSASPGGANNLRINMG
jgi:hypothetical protein